MDRRPGVSGRLIRRRPGYLEVIEEVLNFLLRELTLGVYDEAQNQIHIVLADMLSCKSQLHGVEEIQEGQLGTTIYNDDLKDWDKT